VYYFDSGQIPEKRELYASFGGLLMRIRGEASNLAELDVDMTIYLLIRRA
jgi:hypothetical protein